MRAETAFHLPKGATAVAANSAANSSARSLAPGCGFVEGGVAVEVQQLQVQASSGAKHISKRIAKRSEAKPSARARAFALQPAAHLHRSCEGRPLRCVAAIPEAVPSPAQRLIFLQSKHLFLACRLARACRAIVSYWPGFQKPTGAGSRTSRSQEHTS